MRVHRTDHAGRAEAAKPEEKTGKTRRFSNILEEKRGDSELQNSLLSQHPAAIFETASAKPEQVAAPRDLSHVDQLASEIVSSISAKEREGVQTVDIQFNSRVLDGLQVRLQSEKGAVSVQFFSTQPRVTGLLNSNMANLRAALESRGVRVSQIAVGRRNG